VAAEKHDRLRPQLREFEKLSRWYKNVLTSAVSPPCKMHLSAGGMNQQGKTPMTKKMILAASMMLLSTISGQALAYSNVAPKSSPEAVSHQQVSKAFNVLDEMMDPRVTEPNSYRYRGGPKSND